jgi:hypothetical protein
MSDVLGRLARIDITLPEGQQVPMRLLTPNGLTLGIGPIVHSHLNTFYLKISCEKILWLNLNLLYTLVLRRRRVGVKL